MLTSEQDCRAIVVIAVLACSPTGSRAQAPIKQTTESKKPPKGITTTRGDAAKDAVKFTRVPNVIGMHVDEAQKVMYAAGLKWKITYLAQPDPSLRRGYVSAVVPDVGSLVQPLDEIELRIPLAASLMGKGNLGLADIERRMGFDLDTGRFEEMCGGADFLLLKLDKWLDPGPSYPGASQYFTSDLVMSATGGAKLAPSSLSASDTEGDAAGLVRGLSSL